MRIKGGVRTRKRHNKILKAAKGYKGGRSRMFKIVHQAVMKSGQHAYRTRKEKKADFRALWIIRINAAVRQHGLSYSKFIGALKSAGIDLDRKILAHLAAEEPNVFSSLVSKAKQQLKVA